MNVLSQDNYDQCLIAEPHGCDLDGVELLRNGYEALLETLDDLKEQG